MTTIFISSFHPLISRNILASPVLDLFLAPADVSVVLLVPAKKKSFFETEFGRPGVIVEGVPKELSRREILGRYLSLAALGTRSLDIKRRTEMGGSGEWLSKFIADKSWGRKIIRALDFILSPRGRFQALLERYQPAVVFATDIQNGNDIRLIHEAESLRIPVVGMVRSWDNLTAKGLIRVMPDRLIVHNEIIREEAIKLHGIDPSIISVVGIPHYDRYFARQVNDLERFCARLNLDPKKRLVIYIPLGDRYLGENTFDRDIIQLLASFLPSTHHLLVRLPPMDSVALEGMPSWPNVTVMRPGRQLARDPDMFRTNELTLEDDQLLRDMIFHCDLVVSSPSTFIIDAAVFDKPIILPAFDGRRNPDYYHSVRRYLDYDHQRPVISSGGVRLVGDVAQMREAVINYLSRPAQDQEGRRRIVTEQCWKVDGRSSERLAEVILGALVRKS